MNTLYIKIKEGGLLQYNEYIYERYSYNTIENIWNQQLRHNKKYWEDTSTSQCKRSENIVENIKLQHQEYSVRQHCLYLDTAGDIFLRGVAHWVQRMALEMKVNH